MQSVYGMTEDDYNERQAVYAASAEHAAELLDAQVSHLCAPETTAALLAGEREAQARLDIATRFEAIGCDCPALISRILGADFALV